MLLPGKFIGGFSGQIVDDIGYVNFFIYASLLGIPSILLAIFLYVKKDSFLGTKKIIENQTNK